MKPLISAGAWVLVAEWYWLMDKQLSGQYVQKMATSLKVRDIGSSKHKTDKYVTIRLYMIGKKEDDSESYACI